MRVAPQRWSLWYCRLPIQGHSPLRAVTPPTILWEPNAGRNPQSEKKKKPQTSEEFIESNVCFLSPADWPPTTVSLILLVGTVRDTIALWVHFVDAECGAAVEVVTAVLTHWETWQEAHQEEWNKKNIWNVHLCYLCLSIIKYICRRF